MHEPFGSSPPTTSWEFRPGSEVRDKAEPVTSQGVVLYGDFTRNAQDERLPAGFVDIDDLVEEHERDPIRRAHIEAGRKAVAEQYYANARGLAVLRLRRGWSQRTLAEVAGMKQPHIARLETGQNNPSLDTMCRLAAALNIPIDEFVRELVAPAAERT